jgi:hypothetical protein
MWITLDEAIEMYARYCSARFGAAATEKVKARARDLEKKGDLDGYRIWNRVADQIEKRRDASTLN